MGSVDIHTRPAQADDIAAIGEIVVQSWRQTFDRLLPASFLNSMSIDHQQSRHMRMFPKDGVTYYVASSSEGKVVGFASGGPNRYPAYSAKNELYAINLMPDFVHQGIGRRLFGNINAELAANGDDGLVVMVLSLNPNREFYVKMGGIEVDAPNIQLGDSLFAQTAFIWSQMLKIAHGTVHC